MFKSFLCVVLVGLFGIVSSASANFTKRNNTGLAPFGSSLQAVPQPTIDNVIDRAHQLLGTAYTWGGTSQEQGFDCSGLLVYLFKTEANIVIPRTTAAMHRSTAATIKRNALQPGDAVFSGPMAVARSAMSACMWGRVNSFTRHARARACASTRWPTITGRRTTPRPSVSTRCVERATRCCPGLASA